MCLIIKSKARINKRNIICYKLCSTLYVDLITYFREERIILNHSITPFYNYDKIDLNQSSGQTTNGIHAFSDINTIKKYVRYNTSLRNQIIVKCVIPKGTIYIKGIFNSIYGNYKSISANEMIPLEIINIYQRYI